MKSVRTFYVVSILLCAIILSTSTYAAGRTATKNKNEAPTSEQVYSRAKQKIDDFAHETSCDSNNVSEVKKTLNGLQDYEEQALGIQEFFAPATERALEAWRYHFDLQFRLADVAKKKGCLDLADDLYREVINVYVGSAYAAYRERAKIGIDDVRDLRKK